ncbi:YggT family protein [Rickettsiales endosymbiont of Stachyamoeba lipophora]|uniref:YggT family protein n=1 Tax=Rickettsiales endosymbiont of Stachyamoeba lipophora TaxID=2486578 RepID=UPI000F64FD40|nr:YggT family protein [Rickettsiales endosymbiont of Stachyamoeba lipophora]AZL15248.1 YggT family protein [Rickettsiales endosymbiont of Stachyamoeba lipophora]
MNINPFLDFIISIVSIYKFGLIINIIVNLLVTFEIVNRYNIIVNRISYALDKLYEPVLNKLRSILPNLGVVDISPILLFLMLDLTKSIIINYLYVF